MADQDTQDKHLPASARKLDKAREEGQVPRSRDLGHLLAMLAGFGMVVALAPSVSARLLELLATGLRFDARTVAAPGFMLERLASLSWQMLLVVLPFCLAVAAAAVAASFLSGGILWTFKPLMPNFGRMNPVTGFGRLFSKDQAIEALKVSLLALIVGAVGAFYLERTWPDLVALLALPLPAALAGMGQTLAGAVTWLLVTLTVFALVDLPLQRHLHAQRLKMSVQEARDELKQTEGNQEAKNRVKNIMRERARKRMLARVPTASLVVMNPTHYAVALHYDESSMAAPRVVAKGADLLALRIRDLAREHEVPVLQAAPLARALYAHAEVDREIPLALYSAVAQVLAYVFRLRAALAGEAPYPPDLGDITVPEDLDPHHRRARPAHADDAVD